MDEDDFYTDLGDSIVDIPVRRLGDHYILSYGHMEKDIFLSYIEELYEVEDHLDDDGADIYEEDDVQWGHLSHIDWDEDLPSILFGRDAFSVEVTFIEVW